MVATTMSHCFLAARMRDRWPSCRAPMVGTRPMVEGLDAAARAVTQACLVSLMVWSICIFWFLDWLRFVLVVGLKAGENVGGEMVAFGIAGEGTVGHCLLVLLDAAAEERCCVAEGADELGVWREGEVEEIVEDEDLAVAVGAGSDADGGDAGGGGDAGCDLAGDAFKHDGDGAGGFENGGVGHECVDGGHRAALDAVAAHAVE